MGSTAGARCSKAPLVAGTRGHLEARVSTYAFRRYAELQSYTELDFHPFRSKSCDVVIDKPTVFMKLDAGKTLRDHRLPVAGLGQATPRPPAH